MLAGVWVASSILKLNDSASIVFVVAAARDVSNFHGFGAKGSSLLDSIWRMVEGRCRSLLLYVGGGIPGRLYRTGLKEVGMYSP